MSAASVAGRRRLAAAAIGLAVGLVSPVLPAAPPPVAAEEAATVRVATLLPYVGHALDGIGSATLVGTVVRPGQPRPAAGILDLGDPHSPSFEKLAAARPDLVVADRRIHGLLADELARGGAEVLMVEASSVAATFDGLVEVGQRVGAGEEMRRRIDAARAEIASLRRSEPLEALPMFGAPGSFLAVTGSTWLGDLIAEVGLTNLAAELSGHESFPGYVDLSDEVLATVRPDLVLLVAHGAPEAVQEAIEQRAAAGGPWGTLAERMRVLDPQLFGSNPGLRMPEAARRLAELADAAAAADTRTAAEGGAPAR